MARGFGNESLTSHRKALYFKASFLSCSPALVEQEVRRVYRAADERWGRCYYPQAK